jgi:nitric oxide reductase NorQ protein
METDEGVLRLNGVEVRYMLPQLLETQREQRYVDVFGLLPLVERLSMDAMGVWDPPNLLLSGPQGMGKSLLFAYIAQQMAIPYLDFDCTEDTRQRDLKGGYTSKNGNTPFILGTISNAIQVANEVGKALLVFEEIGSLAPSQQKLVNSLTDFRRKVEVPELGARFSLNPGAVLYVGATTNPASYAGSYELNADLKSRFVELEVPYPSPAAEKRILKELAPKGYIIDDRALDYLVNIARETRQGVTSYALSPRDLVAFLNILARVGWADTLFLIGQKFPPEDRKLVLDRIFDITGMRVFETLTERVNGTS